MLQKIISFLRFYAAAVTRYQLHSPFVFGWANAVLEDRRAYYAFDDIERLRAAVAASKAVIAFSDYGHSEQPTPQPTSLRRILKRAAAAPAQGRRLFRTVLWAQPDSILEMGASLGIGSLYMAKARPSADFLALEGCSACARVAHEHYALMGQTQMRVTAGPFAQTLQPALEEVRPDFIYFDGHHQKEPTLQYFETALQHARARTVFVFDDIYHSKGMQEAWELICQHPQVRLSIDCYFLGFVFIHSEIKEKQHFRIVPFWWKPWMLF